MSSSTVESTDGPAADARRKMGIFVIGCHRSGTTLMRYILDTHPDIACPPESKYLAALPEFFRYPKAVPGLLGMGADPLSILLRLHEMARSFLDDYAKSKNKRRWADKTPNYHRVAEFVDGLFLQQALFVLPIRHPLDVIPSLKDMMYTEFFGGHDDPYLIEYVHRYGAGEYAAAKYWRDVNEHLLVMASCIPERAQWTRYEDLVTRPEAAVERMFRFLGEDFDPAVLDKVFVADHDPGFGFRGIADRSSIDDDRVGKWHDWPEEKRRALWDIVEPVAVKFGYGLDG
ncbi:sulfotransferase [Actinoallomurus acaciae]|uniref:Sulfotransferase n=2 Tax=Actinoallomurus acaciae TaxID=502577 RepID=A0ABV5YNP4_9ACTN